MKKTPVVNESDTEFVAIGKRLCGERKLRHLSQTEFSDRLGLTKETQIQYEAGRRVPNARYLAELHRLGFDVMYILTGSRTMTVPMDMEYQILFDAYQSAPEILQRAAIAFLKSANHEHNT